MPARTAPRPAPRPQAPDPTPHAGPQDLAPWRTISALVEALNAGSTVQSFSVHGVRHYVYMAESGRSPDLLPFVRRIGRKILVSEPGFLRWLESRPSVRP